MNETNNNNIPISGKAKKLIVIKIEKETIVLEWPHETITYLI